MVEFKRKQNENKKKNSALRSRSNVVEKVLIDGDDYQQIECNERSNEQEEPKTKRRKSFSSLSKRMQKIRTDEIKNYLEHYIEKENADM